ncbi:conserved hypothetical protein [Flavobacterium sp. 9AF]|uniref:hypothetical protein n=1 Tax=Flavobacterium sp. 9AF TaxID=2653142 RepID=UPI0012F36224|nr:hypothetical protein [Flavobacterium sp. 9AF]VXB81963.1 conserved hypothetical protein [Flavobacterium sp. 9AF]
MKKVVCSLSVLLAISFFVISYLRITLDSENLEIQQEIRQDKIILLGKSNSYSPILIIKND